MLLPTAAVVAIATSSNGPSSLDAPALVGWGGGANAMVSRCVGEHLVAAGPAILKLQSA